MSTLELILRAAAVAQLAVLTFILCKARRSNSNYAALALLLVGIACYVSAPFTIDHGLRSLASYPIVFMASMIPVTFWYFSCVVFRDEFRLQPWMIVLAALFAVTALLAFCDYANAAQCSKEGEQLVYALAVAGKFLWTLAAFVIIVKDWNVDLVEPRRTLRRLLVFGVGCYILVVLLVELVVELVVETSAGNQAMATLELINSGFILAGVSALTLHLLAPRGDNMFSLMAQAPVETQIDTSPLAKQLLASMQQDRIYARDALTIDVLAQTLRVPVPQLRRVINSELGHRNFNAFINHYRIVEIAQRLEQAEFRDTALLTLALDAGFRSMAPFNRYFKESFKVTPSEYRSSLSN